MTIQQQYQYKYAGQQWDEADPKWQDLPEHHVFSQVLEYRFRDKPSFVPGWFAVDKVAGELVSFPENGITWFEEDPNTNVDYKYVRVNITLAE